VKAHGPDTLFLPQELVGRPKGAGLARFDFDRENVLILSKGDLPVISSLILFAMDRFVSDWSDWILDLQEVLCLS
jgi:hypothetical protein